MKLGYITVMVRDIEKSVSFYEKLVGLKIIRRFNPGMGEIVFMANGEDETMLELIQFEKAEKVSVKGMVISFSVEGSLKELKSKAQSLGYSPSEIINTPPKPPYFTVSDPDGITVEFS